MVTDKQRFIAINNANPLSPSLVITPYEIKVTTNSLFQLKLLRQHILKVWPIHQGIPCIIGDLHFLLRILDYFRTSPASSCKNFESGLVYVSEIHSVEPGSSFRVNEIDGGRTEKRNIERRERRYRNYEEKRALFWVKFVNCRKLLIAAALKGKTPNVFHVEWINS